MSIAALKRVLAAGAICLLAALALPSQANADCCVCTDCPGTSTLCLTVDGCDFIECAIRCEAAGCGDDTLNDAECSELGAVCPQSVRAPAVSPAMLLAMQLLLVTVGVFALRRRSLPIPIRAASLVAVIFASAAAIHAMTQIQVTGQWQADTSAEAANSGEPEQQWRAHLIVGEDGSLSGTVELTGFGDVTVANVEGTLVDGVTSGTLRAPDGTAVAQFKGSANAHAAHGTFIRSGTRETGTFSWSSS